MFKNKREKRAFINFLLVVPFIILTLVFCYYPLYGWVYAFFDYRPPRPMTMESFVGFKWFQSLVESPVKIQQIVSVLRNTFVMSGITLSTSWIPMLFAVFLNEIRNTRFRKFVQTATTLPNFISWVLVYAIAYSVFNSTGAINSILMRTGVTTEPIMFLQSASHVWFKQWLWLTWKNAGWAAIMYIAAITSIDGSLMEAAMIDGASRMQRIWHITIPSILPTYFVLVMMSLANFLSNGMEQYFVFANSFNKAKIEVLDLYVYNLAMGSGGYSLSTAISILKTFVSIILLWATNAVSKKLRGETLI